MENSAFFLSGLTEKKLAIAVTDHLLDIFLLVVKIEFFLRIKEIIFNYTTNQYDHLLDTPDRDNFKRFLQIKDIYLKSDQELVAHFIDVCVKIKTVLTE